MTDAFKFSVRQIVCYLCFFFLFCFIKAVRAMILKIKKERTHMSFPFFVLYFVHLSLGVTLYKIH